MALDRSPALADAAPASLAHYYDSGATCVVSEEQLFALLDGCLENKWTTWTQVSVSLAVSALVGLIGIVAAGPSNWFSFVCLVVTGAIFLATAGAAYYCDRRAKSDTKRAGFAVPLSRIREQMRRRGLTPWGEGEFSRLLGEHADSNESATAPDPGSGLFAAASDVRDSRERR